MVICHIASLPERELSLQKTISSIYNQVDKIYVLLNGYQVKPDWITTIPNLQCEILDNSLGDGAKWLHCWDNPSLCVVLDDDIITPYNYVKSIKDGWCLFGGAVSYHGKRYDKRPIDHFRKNFTANYRCLGSVAQSSPVHIIGTGVLMFNNQQIKFNNSLYEYRNMADVLFSRLCVQQDIPMTVLAHKVGWIRYIPQKTTIWNTSQDDTIPTRLVNEFLK